MQEEKHNERYKNIKTKTLTEYLKNEGRGEVRK